MLTSTLPQLKQLQENWSDSTQWKTSIAFVSYGLEIGIRVNQPDFVEHLVNYLPPRWELSVSSVVDKMYSLIVGEISPDFTGIQEYVVNHEREELAQSQESEDILDSLDSGSRLYILYQDREELTRSQDLEDILDALDSDLRLYIGTHVEDRLFIHAGVVSLQDRAIVIPGRSFSGKTTLVAALVQAGATYYSDEYAVLDRDGRVYPYARPLSIRQQLGDRTKRCLVEELGGKAGTEPISIGLIVNTQYQPDARWSPTIMSPGEAILALLDNTIVARLRPDFALRILAQAVSGALAIQSLRDETQEVVSKITKQLEATSK
jgi:hypothetical protein